MKRKIKQPEVKCPYCGRMAVLRDASYVYKENALDKYLYICSGYPECDAYVGVHAGSLRPKGSLANGDLRHKRIETHRLFDAIWKKRHLLPEGSLPLDAGYLFPKQQSGSYRTVFRLPL